MLAIPILRMRNMPINPPPNPIHPKSRADWRMWLEENQSRTDGVWFISYKKVSGKPRVSYEDAVEEALCFGWINSKGINWMTRAKRIDETVTKAEKNIRANQWRP